MGTMKVVAGNMVSTELEAKDFASGGKGYGSYGRVVFKGEEWRYSLNLTKIEKLTPEEKSVRDIMKALNITRPEAVDMIAKLRK